MPREERPNIFSLEFWQHTITNSVYAFASGALGPLIANQAQLIHSVPWYAALSSGGIGAAIVFLTSLGANQFPNRVPGSFLKETDEEERIERMILREERLAQERAKLRERNEELLMDKHRAEPERERDTDQFINVPPPRRPPVEPPQRLPEEGPRQQRRQAREEERELPYDPRKSVPPLPPREYPHPPTMPPNIPGRLGPKPTEPQQDSDDMENWPQGGRRGKKE